MGRIAAGSLITLGSLAAVQIPGGKVRVLYNYLSLQQNKYGNCLCRDGACPKDERSEGYALGLIWLVYDADTDKG